MVNGNKNFKILLLGGLVSLFGAAILKFSLSLYVLEKTGRADVFGIILAISSIPMFLITPLGGVMADRLDKKKLIVILDCINSFIMLIFLFFTMNFNISIVHITIVMTSLSIVASIMQPVVQSSIPLIVENDKLAQSNGIMSSISALVNIIAPVLGGVLYSFIKLDIILIVATILFILATIAEIFMTIPFAKKEQKGNIIKMIISDMHEGITFIKNENMEVLKFIIIAMLLNLFVLPIILVGIPYIVTVQMSSSSKMLGIVQGVTSLSMVIAGVTIGKISKKFKSQNMYIWVLAIVASVLIMSVSVSEKVIDEHYMFSFIVFTACNMVISFIATIISILVVTFIQDTTPKSLLGKVMAILLAITASAVPIGQVIYGNIFSVFSDSIVILIVSVIISIIAVVTKFLFSSKQL